MAVYTRYAKVLDAEGKQLTVREALMLINEVLDETLAEQEGDFDADSRWAITWFEQVGFEVGEYGMAEQLSKSKNISVSGLVEAGIVASKSGKVRLLKPDELPDDWDPATDQRLSSGETVHHLIRVLNTGGEGAAAKIVAKLGAKAEVARELCYRLYLLCDRKKRSAEALSYNALVQSWPEITRLAREAGTSGASVAPSLFGEDNGPNRTHYLFDNVPFRYCQCTACSFTIWFMKFDKDVIRHRALELISSDGHRVGVRLATEFGLSRQVANGFLQSLIRDGLIEAEGSTRARVYHLKTLLAQDHAYPRVGL